MALADRRLYLNTLDGWTIALDTETGATLCAVRTADPSSGETLPAAPLPSGDTVLLGNAGDRFGVRGWIAALDAADGRILWRRYSTGPDAAVGIGADFRPVQQTDVAAERGVTSWPLSAWQQGGGTVPGVILRDEATGLILHGTGYAAPWVPDQRQGDNRWTSGLFVRDAKTGMARWFLPINTHDLYGLGATAPNLLLDREWERRQRQLLIHPDGTGYVYVVDRSSGEVLSAEAFAPVNATSGVDRRSKVLIRNPDKGVRRGQMTRDICPARPGAVTGASAFLPETGLLYIPSRRLSRRRGPPGPCPSAFHSPAACSR
jgi:glucose dehydrogenase